MKHKKIISAFISASMLIATLPIVNAYSAAVTSELSYYNSSMQASTASDAAYTIGSATISGTSSEYAGTKYIVAAYTDSSCSKITGLQMATFTSNGTNYTAATSALDTSSSKTIKEFFLNAATLKPIAEAKGSDINNTDETWTVNISWQSGPYTSTGADIYNKNIRSMAASDPASWSKYNVSQHITSSTTSFKISTISGTSSWIFNGNCLCYENDNGTISYVDCDNFDTANRTVTLRVWANNVTPTETPAVTPTVAPSEVPQGSPYKFEAENYAAMSEYGGYLYSLYFDSLAKKSSGGDGIALAMGNTTYNLSALNVPSGEYTLTLYGVCYDSTVPLDVNVTSGSSTVTVSMPSGNTSSYAYLLGEGNMSGVASQKISVSSGKTLVIQPVDTTQWILIDYFTLSTSTPTPQPTIIPTETVAPTMPPTGDTTLSSPSMNASVDLNTELQRTFLNTDRSGWTSSDYNTNFYASKHKPNPVTFTWQTSSANSVLEISEDASFSSPLTYYTTAKTYSVSNLKVGKTYYWRVNGCTPSKFTTMEGVRFISAGNIRNTRDIGGKATSSGKKVKQGMFYRGQGMDNGGSLTANAEGLKVLGSDLAIKTDLDLRGGSTVSGGPLKDYGVTLAGYGITSYANFYVEAASMATIKSMFEELLCKSDKYPIYSHCTAGADRTGCVCSLILFFLGCSKDDVLDDYEATLLDATNIVGVNLEERMAPALRALEAFPGTTYKEKATYFLKDKCGISQDTLNQVESIMLE